MRHQTKGLRLFLGVPQRDEGLVPTQIQTREDGAVNTIRRSFWFADGTERKLRQLSEWSSFITVTYCVSAFRVRARILVTPLSD